LIKEVLNDAIQELSEHEKQKREIYFSLFSVTYVILSSGTSHVPHGTPERT